MDMNDANPFIDCCNFDAVSFSKWTSSPFGFLKQIVFIIYLFYIFVLYNYVRKILNKFCICHLLMK